MFVIEKRTHDKIKGYVLDISETRQKKLKEDGKRNSKEEHIVYFEMTFQTQNENQREEKDLHNLKLMVLAVLYQT